MPEFCTFEMYISEEMKMNPDLTRYRHNSPWLDAWCARQSAEELATWWSSCGLARTEKDWQRLLAEATQGLPAADDRTLLELARAACPMWQQALRRLRQRAQARFIVRLLSRSVPLESLMKELSDFADATLSVAVVQAEADLTHLYGQPIGQDSGAPQSLVVLGMGKLGGQELNLSSDIDLIFTYPEEGETNGSRVITNQEFFIKVGQRVIALLDAVTADGFVFRVDMRLRPWGEGSALACGFDALESYYERHGRAWERYALVKARCCAGPEAAGASLLQALRPFIYRRYLDFGAFESLRDMKALIAAEVRRLDREDNIKLGAGGIREIEFIAQAFQLIRGGVDRSLQERRLLVVLPLLAAREWLPAQTVSELIAAYHFLRDSEHVIQALHDQQTQQLPTLPEDQARLAQALGYEDWSSYLAALNDHRQRVQTAFDAVVESRDQAAPEASPLPVAWPERVAQVLASRAVMQLSGPARERLDKLLPRLVAACDAHPEGTVALMRVMPLIEATLRRSAYLVLLIENPEALGRLVDLCAASPWMAELLTRYPVLLDELLNANSLFAPPTRETLTAELREQLLRVPEDDLERQMEALRIFQKGQVLRVAASDLKGTLPLMKISDALTWVAETVLDAVLRLAWQTMATRHGVPRRADGTRCEPSFLIVGYGKLGGLELGYGSDLDLVFLHDGDPQQETDGLKPIDGATFFVRLGQKIIHLLTTAMASGALYEVDMRLRPSGASGLLVTTLEGFRQYQLNSAWTWEHQALVRARVVAGDAALVATFDAIRADVLARPRDLAALRREVVAMRQKMRDHLAPKTPDEVDLKHSPGGLVDIEFLVQYLVLAYAATVPALRQWPDNVRLLETLAQSGHLPPSEAEALTSAYLALRAQGHRQALASAGRGLNAEELFHERAAVQRVWARVMESDV